MSDVLAPEPQAINAAGEPFVTPDDIYFFY